MTIMAIDFEASCLPRHGRSFPIEVGLAGDGGSRSWLIRPHPTWEGWDWTVEAERLHGLTRDELERNGLPAAVVLDQVVDAIGGRRVVADSLIDQYWLDTLAQAAGFVAPFAIEHVANLLDAHAVDEAHIGAAAAMADRLCPVRHHARADALWLATVVEQLVPAGKVAGRVDMMAV